MGNCLAPAGADVKQRRGADAARLKAWQSTGIVTLPPGATEIPAVVFELGPTVKVLDGGGTALSQLPPEVARLTGMTRLSLPKNRLAVLPPAIGALSALRVLQVDSNAISELPGAASVWQGLSRLETLSLSGNRLRSLPAALGALPALRTLVASGNQLASLPPELGGCRCLELLDVSNNAALSALPQQLGSLQRLKSLLADGTAVSVVPAEVLQGCAALQALSLHGCPITAEQLQATAGYEDFEARRRGRFTKIIAGGVAPSKGLDEGVDRELMRSP